MKFNLKIKSFLGTGIMSIAILIGLSLLATAQDKSPAPAQSLADLEAAVTASPDDPDSRARYAQALYKAGSLPSAWEQLMAAYKLKPDHNGVAKGTAQMIQTFSQRDVFTAGIPQESIKGILGEPREVVEMGTNVERWVYAYVALDFRQARLHELIDLRGLTAASFKPTETVAVDLDNSGWRCGHRRRNRGNVVAMYYMPGESYGNWTQQISVERILNGAKMGSVDQIKNAVIKQMQQMVPGTQAKVLDEDENSVIIATMTPNEDPAKVQHKLDRVMKGPVDVHRFAITVVGDEPNREFQMKWLEIAKSAKLKPVEAQK